MQFILTYSYVELFWVCFVVSVCQQWDFSFNFHVQYSDILCVVFLLYPIDQLNISCGLGLWTIVHIMWFRFWTIVHHFACLLMVFAFQQSLVLYMIHGGLHYLVSVLGIIGCCKNVLHFSIGELLQVQFISTLKKNTGGWYFLQFPFIF